MEPIRITKFTDKDEDMRIVIDIPDAIIEDSPRVLPQDIVSVFVPGDEYRIFVRRAWVTAIHPEDVLSPTDDLTEIIRLPYRD